MTSQERRDKLHGLVNEYIESKEAGKLDLTSEETIRTWLNEMLKIFGWDVRDTSQILQEKVLSTEERERLKKIGSTNTRPDYTFKIAKQKLTFLDAKDIQVDLVNDLEAAFQIKSYGWSILAPCAFISNFEQFAIYDCTYLPTKDQTANFGRILLNINEYLDNFEVLENHLLKEHIYGGKLQELYNETSLRGVNKITPDFAFAEILSTFRLQLAKNIYLSNRIVIGENADLLSYLVQVIINRVLFVRVCEARKLEEDGLLLSFKNQGFWNKFKESSYLDFYEHYDGPLFDRIDVIHNLTISDTIFDYLLQSLYYPAPYRFDAIPTKLLSDIYEIFLSKKLRIQNHEVSDQLKSEYTKTQGAVSTPQYIVQEIIRRTLKGDQILSGNILDFLDIKILDFACGSGVFAIEAFDYMEEKLKTIYQKSPDVSFRHLFFQNEHELILNIAGRKAILDNCIFGIDVDPEAAEVTKMALALRIIDNMDAPDTSEGIGLFGRKLLHGIGNNIRCGNTLVDKQILEYFPELIENEDELIKINPFDWKLEEGFANIFSTKGGFDYIIGNPPYVEVKNYNVELPKMAVYLKESYHSAKNGKVDLAIPFIERGIDLLNPTGRMGLIVQKRFFKTEYGKNIRETISQEQIVSSIIDFEANNIFKGRITFVAIMVLDFSRPDYYFYKLFNQQPQFLAAELRNSTLPEIDNSMYLTLQSSSLSKAPWSFEDQALIKIKTKLLQLGTLGGAAKVKVGIQALWGKAYQIQKLSIINNTLIGKSHLEDSFQIEMDACRPLICNEHFYCYRPDSPDAYVIFPYDIVEGMVAKIPFAEFCRRFPLAGAYLARNKSAIQAAVQTLPLKFPMKFGDEFWHIYTREQNHCATYPKIPIPMTALDTFATLTNSDRTYCDNANVNFIELQDASEVNLYAMSGILNSTLFSVLARSIANPQANGYFKFNKQFLEPIPFPVEAFKRNVGIKEQISKIAQTIQEKQARYLKSSPSQRNTIRKILESLWVNLDQKVYQLYGLTVSESEMFTQRGRTVNRVDFLTQ